MTHRSGKGFGQDRSTSYFGTPPCACDEGEQTITAAIANAAPVPTLTRKRVFLFIVVCSLRSPMDSATAAVACCQYRMAQAYTCPLGLSAGHLFSQLVTCSKGYSQSQVGRSTLAFAF
jgi:hypothetical protein